MDFRWGWASAAAICLLVGIFLRGTDLSGITSAGITVDKRQYTVRADAGAHEVAVAIPLTNQSGSKDRLVGVKSSCQCVTAADLPHEVQSGESWNLPLQIDSSTFSPGDRFLFEVTLFLESGSAVLVRIDFEMAES